LKTVKKDLIFLDSGIQPKSSSHLVCMDKTHLLRSYDLPPAAAAASLLVLLLLLLLLLGMQVLLSAQKALCTRRTELPTPQCPTHTN
jgi:hypothetical protein